MRAGAVAVWACVCCCAVEALRVLLLRVCAVEALRVLLLLLLLLLRCCCCSRPSLLRGPEDRGRAGPTRSSVQEDHRR